MQKREFIRVTCSLAVIAATFSGLALLAHDGVELPGLIDPTPNQRVAAGFAHWTVKGDKLQDRIVQVHPLIVTPQPALAPEVQAIVDALPPFVGDCTGFLPPDYKACPGKPIVADGQ